MSLSPTANVAGRVEAGAGERIEPCSFDGSQRLTHDSPENRLRLEAGHDSALRSVWSGIGRAEFNLTNSPDSSNRRGKSGEAWMSSLHRAVRCAAMAVVLIIGSVVAAVAEEIRDWPCQLPLAERFAPEAVWGGPLPGVLPDGWRDDAAVAEVVEFAANPENPPSQGERRIAAFAAALGTDRQQQLLLVFAGVVERFDLLRGFLIEGVRDFVLRAKILREAVDRNEAAVAALPPDGGAEIEEQRRSYLDARFWDARNLDDALEEAEFLCHRYAYLDQKLRQLTEAVRSAL
jgi:hypothetical protein